MKYKYHKLGLALLALTIITTSSSFAAAPFNDIEFSRYKSDILMLQEKGIIHGKGNDKFDPYAVLTMAEGIHLINASFGLNLDHVRFFKEPLATDYFINADDDAWYAYGLIIASVNGVQLKNDLVPTGKFTKEAFIAAAVGYMEV
ncbi:MAG TPA: S-layer homology domain-containing protein, partial [Clostridiales bacterium UBA8960]|nr:S-layer homology domain-containing protein [Clostridiales bacterium UBA8960]